jgi:hypothetical protein
MPRREGLEPRAIISGFPARHGPRVYRDAATNGYTERDLCMRVPFGEQGGRLRGVLDAVSGRFPRFVFGGDVGALLPVFHFHDEAAGDLEPKLRYLAENGYRTVTCDDMAAYARRNRSLPGRCVALCFDDAWASVWTTAAPLLEQYGLQMILYAIPGRTDDATACRPQNRTAPATGSPFMTWPELRAIRAAGLADVQSHTRSHAMIATSRIPTGFVQPGYDTSSYLGRPLLDTDAGSDTHSAAAAGPFVSPDDLGAPLYPTRSRMSDAPRVRHSPSAREACLRLVREQGRESFFTTPDWRDRLMNASARFDDDISIESDEEQRRSIERELDDARAELNARLGGSAVKHVCLPWGVSGRQTEGALKRLGFESAIANRLSGVHAVCPGDDPLWLKRLPNRYIYRLPGRGRRWWFRAAQ